jgi:tetratricopeptide (TPR) repeat protein
VALLDQAIAILKPLVEEGRGELALLLSHVYLNKGNALLGLGDQRGAVALYDQAMAIQERLVRKEGRADLANDLARTYMNKAMAVSNLGDNRGAVALFDQVIAIRERLVQEGRAELQGDLAKALLLRAGGLLPLGNHDKARVDARKAMQILQAEIARTGRADLQSLRDSAAQVFKDVL